MIPRMVLCAARIGCGSSPFAVLGLLDSYSVGFILKLHCRCKIPQSCLDETEQ